MVLTILFWILLILALLSNWAPDTWRAHSRYVDLILILILGLKCFGMPS